MPRHRDQTRATPAAEVAPRPARASGRAGADELLSAAGRGDAEALGCLYDQTAPVVFGLLRSVLENPAQAEQATERVYLRLWRLAPLFDPADACAFSLLLSTARRELIGPGP